MVLLKEACHLNNADCQLKLDNFSLAVAQAEIVLASGKNLRNKMNAYFFRGQAYHKMHQLSAAREDLKKAHEMDPNARNVAVELAEVEQGEEREREAKKVSPREPHLIPSQPLSSRSRGCENVYEHAVGTLAGSKGI